MVAMAGKKSASRGGTERGLATPLAILPYCATYLEAKANEWRFNCFNQIGKDPESSLGVFSGRSLDYTYFWRKNERLTGPFHQLLRRC